MDTKQMMSAVFGTILKVALAVIVIIYVYKGALLAYDYGYRIYTEPAMSTKGNGWDVTVEVTMGKSVLEIGEILEAKGLVRDSHLFYVQNILSEYKDKLKPGVYTLNTTMTAKEIMEVMATEPKTDSGEEG